MTADRVLRVATTLRGTRRATDATGNVLATMNPSFLAVTIHFTLPLWCAWAVAILAILFASYVGIFHFGLYHFETGRWPWQSERRARRADEPVEGK